MTHYIIENCWNQAKRYNGIKEYYDLIKNVCHEVDGVELFGLFRPLNESWHWTYILDADDLEKWEGEEDEIACRYFDKRDNIIQSFPRMYTEHAYNPKPKNTDLLNIFR